MARVMARLRRLMAARGSARSTRKRPKDLMVIPERIEIGAATNAILMTRRLDSGLMAAGGTLIGCAKTGGRLAVFTLEGESAGWGRAERVLIRAGAREVHLRPLVRGEEGAAASFIGAFAPDLVFLPSPVEDGSALSRFSGPLAMAANGRPGRFLGYELHAPLLPDSLVDITPFLSLKEELGGSAPEVELAFSLNQYRSLAVMRGRGFAEAYGSMAPETVRSAAGNPSVLDAGWDRGPIPYFRGVSRLPAGRPARGSDADGIRSVLVLSPHFDDETIGCGGALLGHAGRGDRTTVVFATDGREGDPREKDRDGVSEIRKREAREAAAILGVGRLEFLDRPETRLRPGEGLEDEVGAILVREDPDVVYLPSFLENHIDHFELNRVFYRAARGWKEGREVRLFGLWTPFPPNHLVEIGDLFDRKVRAVNCYRSQLTQVDYLSATISLNRYWSIRSGDPRGYAEAFCSMTVKDYCALFEGLGLDRDLFQG